MNSKKASTLILALWTLSFLTVFAVALSYNVSMQLRLASYFQDRVKTYALAYAGVQRTIMQLAFDETPNYDCLTDAWLSDVDTYKEIPLGDGYATIGYTVGAKGEGGSKARGVALYGLMDESMRININRASKELLQTLFKNAGGLDEDESRDVASSILDWRDADVILSPGGAEDTYYAKLKNPYPCKDAEFEAIEELLLVKGVTPEVFAKVRDVVTVYGSGKININTADAQLFQALGLSPELAQRIVEYRRGADQIDGTEDDVIFESVGAIREVGSLFTQESEDLNRITSSFTVKSDVFRIRSSGVIKRGEREVTRRIICVVSRNQKEGAKILHWHEE